MKKIDQTSCTELGGELRNNQRRTLDGIDEKCGRFNLNIWNCKV